MLCNAGTYQQFESSNLLIVYNLNNVQGILYMVPTHLTYVKGLEFKSYVQKLKIERYRVPR